MARETADRGLPEMPAQDRTPAVASFAELEQFFTNCRDVGFARRERFPKFHRRGIRNSPRPFGEKPLALEGKNGPPELIEPDRHHRSIRLPGDDLVATPQPEEGTGTRQLSFRKKTNDFAIANLFGRQTHRILRPARRNWDATNGAQDRMQETVPVIFLIDNETNRPWAGDQEDERVDPRDVVGQKQKSATRQTLRSEGRDPINQPHDQQPKGTQDTFGGRNWRHWFMIYNLRDAHCNRQFDDDRT